METRKVIATANNRNKTFTLRVYDNRGNLIAKYRTLPFSKEEFEDNKNNTSNDWLYFLRTEEYYYEV